MKNLLQVLRVCYIAFVYKKKPKRSHKSCRAVSIVLILALSGFYTRAQQISILNGGYLTMKGNVSLVIKDAAFLNNGQFSSVNGTVKFTGNADTSISYISGNSTTN